MVSHCHNIIFIEFTIFHKIFINESTKLSNQLEKVLLVITDLIKGSKYRWEEK